MYYRTRERAEHFYIIHFSSCIPRSAALVYPIYPKPFLFFLLEKAKLVEVFLLFVRNTRAEKKETIEKRSIMKFYISLC